MMRWCALVLCCFGLLPATRVHAVSVNPDLEARARLLLLQKLSAPGYEVHIGESVWSGVSMRLPVDSYQLSFEAREPWRRLQCVKVQSTQSTAPLCFTVAVKAKVPVAKRALPSGAVVSTEDFVLKEVDLTSYSEKVVAVLKPESGQHWKALSKVREGEPAWQHQWQLVQTIMPAERTRAQLKFSQGAISVPVVAVQSGAVGQTVLVRREQTPYLYQARITSEKKLEIVEP
ncbi:MAG: flagella basal body P-ring formation protein FlgA [Burkholderiales bacterium]|nr:flagella basal body P-ring formation protein FlgA [Burkholderiales bacterium]